MSRAVSRAESAKGKGNHPCFPFSSAWQIPLSKHRVPPRGPHTCLHGPLLRWISKANPPLPLAPREDLQREGGLGLGLGPVLLASARPLAGMVCVHGGRGGADRSPAPPPLRSSLVVRFGSTGEGRGVGVPTPVLRGGRTVHEEGWVVPSFPAGEASSSGPHPDAGSRSAPLTSRSPKSGGPLGFARTELGWETRTSSPQDGGSQLMAWVCGGHRRRQGPEPPRPRGGRGLGEGRSQD